MLRGCVWARRARGGGGPGLPASSAAGGRACAARSRGGSREAARDEQKRRRGAEGPAGGLGAPRPPDPPTPAPAPPERAQLGSPPEAPRLGGPGPGRGGGREGRPRRRRRSSPRTPLPRTLLLFQVFVVCFFGRTSCNLRTRGWDRKPITTCSLSLIYFLSFFLPPPHFIIIIFLGVSARSAGLHSPPEPGFEGERCGGVTAEL